MQIIEGRREHNHILEQFREQLVGEESEVLSREFEKRRKRAIKKYDEVHISEHRKIGWNSPCPCGSDLKFKKCCGKRLASSDSRIDD